MERRLPAGRSAAFQAAGRMPAVRPAGSRRSEPTAFGDAAVPMASTA